MRVERSVRDANERGNVRSILFVPDTPLAGREDVCLLDKSSPCSI